MSGWAEPPIIANFEAAGKHPEPERAQIHVGKRRVLVYDVPVAAVQTVDKFLIIQDFRPLDNLNIHKKTITND